MLIRSTKLRRAIMDILATQDRPLSIPDLQCLLAEEGMKPHKTSLYRSLEKMSKGGNVHEVILDTSGLYYELQHTHHHHALCDVCQKVICVKSDVLKKGVSHLENVARQSGFVPREHHIILKGICSSCQTQ